jgi:hypothetical protein
MPKSKALTLIFHKLRCLSMAGGGCKSAALVKKPVAALKFPRCGKV